MANSENKPRDFQSLKTFGWLRAFYLTHTCSFQNPRFLQKIKKKKHLLLAFEPCWMKTEDAVLDWLAGNGSTFKLYFSFILVIENVPFLETLHKFDPSGTKGKLQTVISVYMLEPTVYWLHKQQQWVTSVSKPLQGVDYWLMEEFAIHTRWGMTGGLWDTFWASPDHPQ